MKISTKLVVLTVGSSLAIAVAVLVYFVILAPVDRMLVERDYLAQAANANLKIQVELNRLMGEPLVDQYANYQQALREYKKSMDHLSAITVLLGINPTLDKAVKTIIGLKTLTISSLATVDEVIAPVLADLKEAFTVPESNGIYAYYAGPDTENGKLHLFNSKEHINNLQIAVAKVNQMFIVTINTVAEQYALIDAEISLIKSKGLAIAFGIMGFLMVASILLSLILTRSIGSSIRALAQNIGAMGSGDLRGRFKLTIRDEVGELGRDLDGLLAVLIQSFREIQQASDENLQVKNELVIAVTETTSASVEIEANSNSIKVQMERMDTMIEQSVAGMESMDRNIGIFNQRIVSQNEHVASSAAAITEMMAAIGNISRITEKDRLAAEALVKQANHGQEVFDVAFEKVAEINDRIDLIQDMATVIAGVATQTNILAMNAAIEAAHAGEFGKGFAVVADEIGKLATTSANSSEEIARTIKDVVLKISEAAETKNSTVAAFEAISKSILEVSESVIEIHGNVTELQSGSRQIQEAVEQLRHTSTGITEDARGIGLGSQELGGNISLIGRISHEVVSNISEITVGLRSISGAVGTVSDHTGRLDRIGESLDLAVKRFRIAD